MKKRILYLLAFLIKGWEVSLLLILPFLQTQGKITIIQLGILAATFSLFQILSSLFAGHFSHKFGGKKVIISAILFYLFAWIGISFIKEFYFLFLVFCLGGLGSGLFMPLANSAIAQMVEKNRAQEMGNFSAFTDIGRVILTSLTSILISRFGLISLLGYGLMAVLAIFLSIKLKIFDLSIKDEVEKLESIKITDLLKIKSFVLSLITGMGDAFASSSLYIFIPLLLVPKGIAIESVGFLSALFFLGFLAGRLFLGRLADKYGPVKILIISEVFMALLIICLVFLNNLFTVSTILFLLGIFTRGTSPVIRAMVAESINEKHKFDKAYSLYSFSVNSSSVTSRTIYGFLAGVLGISFVFYLSGAVALLTIIPISLFHKNSTRV